MSQVTVTDVQEVAMMETDDIRKWISLHQKSLKDDEMEGYHDAIKDDLDVLIAEYKLRNPMVVAIKELTKEINILHGQVSKLNNFIKEKHDGNVKD